MGSEKSWVFYFVFNISHGRNNMWSGRNIFSRDSHKTQLQTKLWHRANQMADRGPDPVERTATKSQLTENTIIILAYKVYFTSNFI